MKARLYSTVTLVLVVIAVAVNSVCIVRAVNRIENEVNYSDLTPEQTESAYRVFQKHEMWIGLSVNHSDMTNVEEAFADWIGAAKAGDADAGIEAKSRLRDALHHLRRQSEFSVDSIF